MLLALPYLRLKANYLQLKFSPIEWLGWSIAVSLGIVLMVTPIVQHGMFIDGLAYVNIAKNIAAGDAGVWLPYVDVGQEVFYGHPPLVFYLESLFFRLFGDGLHTEDVYNGVILLLTILGLFLLWRKAMPAYKHYFFVPLLLFVLCQEVQLRYPNNMLECTLSMFILFGVYAVVKFQEEREGVASVCAGLAAFLGFLCKGPVALFILATGGLYAAIVQRRFSLGALTIPTMVFTACLGTLCLASPAAAAYLYEYFDVQLVTALSGKGSGNIANSRYSILYKLVKHNVIQLALLGIAVYAGSRNSSAVQEKTSRQRRLAWFFTAVGLSAVLPIIASTKQASYYQLPSLPYFYLAMSIVIVPVLHGFVKSRTLPKRTGTVLTVVAATLMTVSLAFTLANVNTINRRNIKHIADVDAIAAIMQPAGATYYHLITEAEPPHLQNSFTYYLAAFLNRYHDIYATKEPRTDYWLDLRQQDGELLCEPQGELLYQSQKACFGSNE